jgi:predicted DsbA family dithiol-disulfide isomerase
MSSEGRKKIVIEYFTDVLCIWAYGAQIRVDELNREFRDDVEIVYRFIPLFGATSKRMGEGWSDRGGFEGFNRHTLEVARAWDHVSVDPGVWVGCRPPSSIVVHLFLKAVQLVEQAGDMEAAGGRDDAGRTPFEAAVWRAREAFFGQARNVCERAVQLELAEELALPIGEITRRMENGEAYAALHEDHEAQTEYRVPGSPTLIMNEGRQRLYGNLGYRILRANVEELLRDPRSGEASWC